MNCFIPGEEFSVSELLERANNKLGESSQRVLSLLHSLTVWTIKSPCDYQVSELPFDFMSFHRESQPHWRRHRCCWWDREERRPLHQLRLQVGEVDWWESLYSLLHRQSLLWVYPKHTPFICFYHLWVKRSRPMFCFTVPASREKSIITRGLESFSSFSCIRFRPSRSTDRDWLSIESRDG